MYNKDTEYNVKYVTKDGKEETKQITPSEDMSKPQMIMKLKEEDKNFFKLLESVEYISKSEYDKIPNDYKTTIAQTLKARQAVGDNVDNLKKLYKNLGYDETDPMILANDNGSSILKPVKIKKEEFKMSRTLFDYLEDHSFEDTSIKDEKYGMECIYELCIEDADKDPIDMFMSKLAKCLNIISENDEEAVVDLTSWVENNYDLLESLFDVDGQTKDECIESFVCQILPDVFQGYATDSVYKALCNFKVTESKQEYKQLENVDSTNELKSIIQRKSNGEKLTKKDLLDSWKEWCEDNNWTKEEYPFEDYLRDVGMTNEFEMIESKLQEDDNGDYNYLYSPRQIIEICEDRKYKHAFDEESGTIEELEKELQDIKRIESEKPITTIEEPLTDKYPGWKNCKVKTILKDGREFVSEEETLSVWAAVQLVVADEVMKESRKPLSEEVEKEETLDEVINRAHQEEISAIDTYDTVLSKTDESTDAKLIEMINEIKKDEEDHKTLLQHYIETGEVWTDEDLEKENSEKL